MGLQIFYGIHGRSPEKWRARLVSGILVDRILISGKDISGVQYELFPEILLPLLFIGFLAIV